jgi:hypothetical protein
VELARANDYAMRATLTQMQFQRLEQITLQVHGPMAFGQADVATRLHLTDAQRQAIRDIVMDAFSACRPRYDQMVHQARRCCRFAATTSAVALVS